MDSILHTRGSVDSILETRGSVDSILETRGSVDSILETKCSSRLSVECFSDVIKRSIEDPVEPLGDPGEPLIGPRDPREPVYESRDPYYKFGRRLVENLLPRRVRRYFNKCIQFKPKTVKRKV